MEGCKVRLKKVQVNCNPVEWKDSVRVVYHAEKVARNILEKVSAGWSLSEAILSIQQEGRNYSLASLRSSIVYGPLSTSPAELLIYEAEDVEHIAQLYRDGRCKDSMYVKPLMVNPERRIAYGFAIFFYTELRGQTYCNSIAVEVPQFKRISRKEIREKRRADRRKVA